MLDVVNVRNIETAKLEFASGLNFLLGPNGSGKSSFIEAIYLLGRGRSFRVTQPGLVISHLKESLLVGGQLFSHSDAAQFGNIRVSISRRKRDIQLFGVKAQSSVELIRAFPLQLIHPPSSTLLDAAPRQRRQFLDWGVFHVEHDYLDQWRGYAKVLNQRNSLLRAQNFTHVATWNHQLDRYGIMLAAARERYVSRLLPFLTETAADFLPGRKLEFKLTRGWEAGLPFSECLEKDTALDLRDGYTHSGPHKADFSLHVDGRSARNYLSRGQMKLLVFALLLAQAQLMAECTDHSGALLIDDLSSELDADNLSRMLRFLDSTGFQVVVTGTDQGLPDRAESKNATVFHVEHGRATKAT